MARPRLVVMVKVPRAGHVKTRLARAVGTVTATFFYRHAVAAVVGRLAGDRRWQTVLAVAPAGDVGSRALVHGVDRTPQASGSLGVRMHALLNIGRPGPVVIVGSDIPAITAADVARAFKALGSAAVVLGPAPDGGYWLVGARYRARGAMLFDNVRWSTEHARADTRRNAGLLSTSEVGTLADVDDQASFIACRGWSGRRILPARPLGHD